MKEWMRVTRSTNGNTSKMIVTVTLQLGTTTVKWAEPCYRGTVKQAVASARAEAKKLLEELAQLEAVAA